MVEDSLTKYLHCMLDTRYADRSKIPLIDRAITTKLEKESAIVFANMSDFTSRVHRYGIIQLLSTFQHGIRLAQPVIQQYNGSLVKLDGNSLLMTFGNVRSAAAATLELNNLYQEYNASVPQEDHMEVSFGIGFGKILMTETDAFGEEVNLASKLSEDLASPGQILLTPNAYHQVREIWRFQETPDMDFGSFQIKGYRLLF